ncbi:MAG: hypothetical protein BGO69_11035 [Bacteroidetes bacterium 46-16]|nr:MAG: hypothetical protein BGO69_11035 [Bacteroidetes bacterium 46-16]
MRKHFYVLLCALFIGYGAQASPGDTTWVQAHYDKWLDYYNNFDTTVTFPNGSVTYRKIYMIFTLGKYQCPGNPQYCGDWDYTITNYLMTPSGDTLELARLISPYANAGAPHTPWSWTQRYIYDVTDYYPVLKNSATMRILYSGYSGGFTANVKFAFIEGTPDRDVKGITRLWNGSFGYGNAIPIDTNFQSVNETAPTGTQSTDLKLTITGHGSDNNQCCEFLSRYYEVMLNNNQVAHTDIWRNDCGLNDLYPQSGTWLYERANWCPGALVRPNYHNLPGIVAGNNFDVEINFQPYTGNGGGSYTTEAQLFYHGSMNKTVDASLDDIIAPTNYEGSFRANPVCGSPTIHVKNTGATAITSIHFQYGAENEPVTDYTWNGNLNSLQDTIITLPHLPYLDTISDNNLHKFTTKIMEVNGNADDDATNNTMSSYFMPAPLWPSQFLVQMKTNSETDQQGNCETTWQIFDQSNNVVAQRITSSINTIYTDTVFLPRGCYKMVVKDGSCDGLHWWVWDQVGGVTAGYIQIKKLPFGTISLNGNVNSGTYHDDFGCGFNQYFTTQGFGVGVENLSATPASVAAYPNPAQSAVTVSISGIANISGTVSLVDALGRTVLTQNCNSTTAILNVANLANGMYTVIYSDRANAEAKLQTRLLIAK